MTEQVKQMAWIGILSMFFGGDLSAQTAPTRNAPIRNASTRPPVWGDSSEPTIHRGPSTRQSDGSGELDRWPAPVRLARYNEPMPDHHASDPIQRPSGWKHSSIAPPFSGPRQLSRTAPLSAPAFGSQPHHVLQAPGQSSQSEKEKLQSRYSQTHPPLSSLHRRVQPAPPRIPEASQREVWKTPYSYGYFGASGKRRWSKHYGYRNGYTEWRFGR